MNNIKKIISTLLFIVFITSIASTNANSLIYSKKIRAKIMNDFKDQQYENIYDSDNVLLSENLNFFETQNKIWNFEAIRQSNLSQKYKLLTQKKVVTSRIMNLEETISSLDWEIKDIETEITTLNRDITTINEQIKNLKSEMEEIQKEISKNKEILLEYISHIYKKSNLVFANNEVDSLKTLFLNNASLWDVLSEIHFSSLLEITWQTLVEKHRKLVRQIFVKKLEMDRESENLRDLRKQELVNRKIQLDKKNFRQKILDYTKWEEKKFEEFIEARKLADRKIKLNILQSKIKIKDQKKELLTKYNCDYIDENKLKIITNEDILFISESENNCLNLNKILTAESKLTPMSKETKNIFSWPIIPIEWLSAYFKDKEYEEVVWSSHEAIDIKAPQWTDIIAPADWYITYLKAPDDGTYAYAVLKHADWFITVYGHISEVLYNQYDFIKAWTIFAKSWWEPWTNWAWAMTTWPHLHFEIFRDKEYVDPLEYLDLTELWDKAIPPEQKYIYKFYDDYKIKNLIEYKWELVENAKIFTLSGSTEEERQKDLLAKYAIPEFNNWDVWIEEAVDGNIDPSFIMCIGLSESWLGRNLKTAYNVWNVGNTDSWWTWDFENARSWIYRIVKTLNNQFLWEYNDMSKLSRYWNKSWSIYASSPVNWQRNMTRCLSALKDRSIPDNYNFRVLY